MNDEAYQTRYYTSYSGVTLPLKLIGEIPEQDMRNRNTYFEGAFDPQDRLCICRKIVYGETEVEHRYDYHANGALKQAIISEADDEFTTLNFNEQGHPI